MEQKYIKFKQEINNYIDEVKFEFNETFDNVTKIVTLMDKNNGYITTKEIDKNKISRDYLKKMISIGYIRRVDRGIYLDCNKLEDSFYTLCLRHPNIIFSHFTSLYFHNMTEVYPIVYDITCINNVYANDFKK